MWPAKDSNFQARDGKAYCRIYRINGGPQDGRWWWGAARETKLGEGVADTAREAALDAERVFLGT